MSTIELLKEKGFKVTEIKKELTDYQKCKLPLIQEDGKTYLCQRERKKI
jgi:hypothetical protein